MATGNFIPHENGIYMLQEPSWEDTREYLLGDFDEEEVTDEMIRDTINIELEWMVEEYWEYLSNHLPSTLYLVEEDEYTAEVYNNQDKILARLELRGGYYGHVQVIVETDPYELLEAKGWYWESERELLTEFTPHNKRLFKAIEKTTTPLKIAYQFSNGETGYAIA